MECFKLIKSDRKPSFKRVLLQINAVLLNFLLKNPKKNFFRILKQKLRNLISCKAALQRLYRKKRYTNNLELNWIFAWISLILNFLEFAWMKILSGWVESLFLFSVLWKSRRYYPGGHLRGISHHRCEKAPGGKGVPTQDLCLLFSHN